MKNIKEDAKRQRQASIWTSFAIGNKRHLLLTGGRGAGKTTLFCAIKNTLMTDHERVVGFETKAVAKSSVTFQSFKEDEIESSIVIGRYVEDLSKTENKMHPVKEGLRQAAKRIRELGSNNRSGWFLIDEIGYLESECDEYMGALRETMDRFEHVVACVRKQELGFLKELCSRKDVLVVDLDEESEFLMHKKVSVGCVIMASGEGKRFGGNKLMALLCDRPVIDYVLKATDKIFDQRIVVTRHESIQKLCLEQGIDCILHDLPYRSDTVRLATEQMDPKIDQIFFFSGDQPLIRKRSILKMIDAVTKDPSLIGKAAYHTVPGAPMSFPAGMRRELMTLPTGKGGNFLAKKYPERVRLIEVEDASEMIDIDEKKTHSEVEQILINKRHASM